jgi:hypothetical protein
MGGDRHRCYFPTVGNWLLGVSTAFGLARRLAASSLGSPAIALALELLDNRGQFTVNGKSHMVEG